MCYQVRHVRADADRVDRKTSPAPDGTKVSNKSFENLVNEHGRQVLGTAARVLRDTNLAHDVHQEVFLAVWRRWHSYNGDVNWPAYLYRATVRKALELARRRGRKETSSLKCQVSSGDDRALQSSPAPDASMQADELEQKLAAALARLPQRQADAFVLSRIEKRETAEIAKLLGCSEPTVRVHLHRAVLKLAVELHEYLDR
jgi:RNA polymerase sigma-70 factor, ECF subfamily